jgi:hypothetical protein
MSMLSYIIRAALVSTTLVVLVACSSSDDAAPDLSINEPEPQTETGSQGPWKARNIIEALSGRTFTYTDGKRQGQVTYNSDYTFSYREEGKGEGTGIWQPSDEQLCEAFDPTSFMPRGSPSRCQPFSAIDDTYSIGTKKLHPA